MSAAIELKDKGNALFSSKNYEEALKEYDAAIRVLEKEREGREDEWKNKEENKTLAANLHANRAACLRSLSRPASAIIEACTAALNIHPGHPKALYRRALAYEESGEISNSLTDAKLLVSVAPKDVQAKELMHRVTGKAKAVAVQEAQMRDPSNRSISLLQKLGGEEKNSTDILTELCRLASNEDVQKQVYIKNDARLKTVIDALISCDDAAGKIAALKILFSIAVGGGEAGKQAIVRSLSAEAAVALLRWGVRTKDLAGRLWTLRIVGKIAAPNKEDESGKKSSSSEGAQQLAAEGAISVALDLIKELSEQVLNRLGWKEEEEEGKSKEEEEEKVKSLTKEEEDEQETVALAVELLAQICTTKEGTREFERLNGFKLVFPLCAMEEVQMKARLAMLLQRVIDNRSREENDFLSKEILPHVMYSLSWAKTQVDQCRAAGAISILAQTMDGADKLLLDEGVSFKLSKWIKATSSPRVQRSILSALSELVGGGAGHAVKIGQADVLDVLLGLASSKNLKVKGCACVLLARISCVDHDARDIIVAEGGAALMAALPVATPSLDVWRIAAEGLAFLAVVPDARDQFMNSDIFPSLTLLCDASDGAVQLAMSTALHNALRKIQTEFEDEEKAALRKLQLQTEAAVPKEQVEEKFEQLRNEAKMKEEATDKFRTRFIEGGGLALLVALAKSKSITVLHRVADILAALSLSPPHRGPLVQRGALRLCVDLGVEGGREEKKQTAPLPYARGGEGNAPLVSINDVQDKAAECISRIAISTNPTLFPPTVVPSLVRPLLRLCERGGQLQQFEAAIALTNLASLGEEMRERIVSQHGWRILENLCTSENHMVVRAAVGGLCNIVLTEQVFEGMLSPAVKATDDERYRPLRIFLVLAGSDDEDTARYAMGALANISNHNEQLCDKIIALGGVSKAVNIFLNGVSSAFYPALLLLDIFLARDDKIAHSIVKEGGLPPLWLVKDGAGQPEEAAVALAIEVVDKVAQVTGAPRSCQEATGSKKWREELLKLNERQKRRENGEEVDDDEEEDGEGK